MQVRLNSNLFFYNEDKILTILLFILSIFFIICGLVLFYKTNQIKLQKDKEQEQYKQQLKKEVNTLQIDRNNLINSQIQKKKQLNNDLIQFQKFREKELNNSLQKQEQLIKLKIQKANQQASQEIENIHKDLNNIRESATKEKQQIQNKINELKASLSAGTQARLREQQKKDKINFYKLSISDPDLSDVKMLENLKISFHKPVVLSKLIWTQYFQKQMTELCDRVLGKKSVCGIYKITNLLTEQCYIGQSVNISDRWKQHCKCGLGIEASTTNKLYNSMQKDGVWNFTFELLEQCSKENLNQKEKFWIEMYQSNKFGLNIMKGNH